MRQDLSSLGELILIGALLFVLASPVVYVALLVVDVVLSDIEGSATKSTLFTAALVCWWGRRFWRRYSARRDAHDLYYRHGVGERPDSS